MRNRDVVVIGGSAGALEALVEILGALPTPFPAAVFVVIHTTGNGLARVLAARTGFRVSTARNNEPITPGRVYVAPGDHHMILDGGRVRVTRGPRENRARPAIDPLFRSAALARGRRVVGVILSGMLDDGTSGLWSIKDQGGTAVVQDRQEAPYPSMVVSALDNVAVDYEQRAAEIGPLLARLVREPVTEAPERPVSPSLLIESAVANEENALRAGSMELGALSPYTCPECHGVLSQIREGGILRFRCHTGHAYSAGVLLASLKENAENDLWSAVRSLEETVILTRHIAEHLAGAGRNEAARAALQEAALAERRSEQVRQIALDDGMAGEPARREA